MCLRLVVPGVVLNLTTGVSSETDAVIDSQLELPRAAGTNVAIFRDTFELLG
jgi:hypothetical protein